MRYVCPKCGSQLVYWQEMIFEQQQLVNIRTGKLNKKIKKTEPQELDTAGLSCSKCDFIYYGNKHIDKVKYEYLDKIFKSLK